jgi:hypothetical protein
MGEGGWWDNESIDQWYPCENCNGFGRVWKMGDLIERLRTYSDQLGGITDEAADEIERWKTIAKTLFKSKVLKMQGFSDPFYQTDFTTVHAELRLEGIDVDAFLKRCNEAVEQGYTKALQNGCNHIIVEDDCGSAVCGKCDKDFGWYCQIATKHFCEYEGDECCIHCGAPEERQ